MPVGTLQGKVPSPVVNAASALQLKGQLVHYGLTVASPIISPASGEYEDEVEVSMTCATPDAVIHYRLDGQTPTEADPIYSAPFVLVP